MNSNELSRTFTDRSNCRRAAKRECGDAFEIEPIEGGGFAFRRLPATRFPGVAKAIADIPPGLARLRAAASAETIREATIGDQVQELQAQAERMNGSRDPQSSEAGNCERKRATPSAPRTGKRAGIVAAAQAGALPTPPDFSAPTHTRFRGKLADLVKLAEAGDIEGLRAYAINPVSSSPKALDRYRNLCVIALEARALKKAA